MSLTGKQKRYLRSLGQTMPALFQIGKEGVGKNFVEMVDDALRVRELVKIRFLRSVDGDHEELAFDLAMHTKSEVVQQIGNTILLYRKAKEPKIILP